MRAQINQVIKERVENKLPSKVQEIWIKSPFDELIFPESSIYCSIFFINDEVKEGVVNAISYKEKSRKGKVKNLDTKTQPKRVSKRQKSNT